MSRPGTHESADAHVERMWFVVKGMRNWLRGEGAGERAEADVVRRRHDELLQLSHLWVCGKRMGCVYSPELARAVDEIGSCEDVWKGRPRAQS